MRPPSSPREHCNGRRVFLERERRPRAVVVAGYDSANGTEVSLVQDDQVVEELAAEGADHARRAS